MTHDVTRTTCCTVFFYNYVLYLAGFFYFLHEYVDPTEKIKQSLLISLFFFICHLLAVFLF